MTACRDFLAAALARAKTPPPRLDLRRLKEESDADFAAGRSITYNSLDELQADLTGDALRVVYADCQ